MVGLSLGLASLALSGSASAEIGALPSLQKVRRDRAHWRAVDLEVSKHPEIAGKDPIDSGATSSDRLTQDPTQFQVQAQASSDPVSGTGTPALIEDRADLDAFHVLTQGDSASLDDESQPQISTRMTIHVFKRPVGLTADDEQSIDYEFGVAELDGKLMSVFAISSAASGHSTIVVRDQPLSIEKESGYPYPWHRSSSYENSPMFWGLQIDGSYWIHATPHYGFLGQPASMGCVRASYPTAMELWDTAVNFTSKSAKINIYGSGTTSQIHAYHDLRARFNLPPSEINRWVEADLHDAHLISHGDYNGNGHWRETPNRILDRFHEGYYPLCKGKSCFSVFNKTPHVQND